MKVYFLGCGDAFGSGGRNQSAYLIQSEELLFLLDCGPATLPAMKKAGIDPRDLNAVVLSHLHGDHFGGLPFLFMEFLYNRPRSKPLNVVGPAGTEERAKALLEVMYGARELPLLEFQILQPDTTLALCGALVSGFRVPHQTEPISLGLKFSHCGRQILFSGDSGWTDSFVDQSRDVDLFICECCFYDRQTSSHLCYKTIEENLPKLQCKRLILTHMGDDMLARRRELPVMTAEDGLVLEI